MILQFSIEEKFIDTHITNDSKYLLERTYFITTSDNTICLIAVVEKDSDICNLSIEDRFMKLIENQDRNSVICISKSNGNQIKWLSDNLRNFLSK